jgi:hypothetical protein
VRVDNDDPVPIHEPGEDPPPFAKAPGISPPPGLDPTDGNVGGIPEEAVESRAAKTAYLRAQGVPAHPVWHEPQQLPTPRRCVTLRGASTTSARTLLWWEVRQAMGSST